VQILAHSVQVQKNGGLKSVWVRLEYSDGSKTDGYVRSDFLADSDEGLDLSRAYTKGKEGQKVLKYMPFAVGMKQRPNQARIVYISVSVSGHAKWA
tara:strand:- start:194 stop:481 length:288 start_codon:yes stop_codon:yes gene_type:complete